MKVEEDWDCCQRERRIGRTSLVRVLLLMEQTRPLVLFLGDQQRGGWVEVGLVSINIFQKNVAKIIPGLFLEYYITGLLISIHDLQVDDHNTVSRTGNRPLHVLWTVPEKDFEMQPLQIGSILLNFMSGKTLEWRAQERMH